MMINTQNQIPSWVERAITVSMETSDSGFEIEIIKVAVIEVQLLVLAILKPNFDRFILDMFTTVSDTIIVKAPEHYPEKVFVVTNPNSWYVEEKYKIIRSRKPLLEIMEHGIIVFDKYKT